MTLFHINPNFEAVTEESLKFIEKFERNPVFLSGYCHSLWDKQHTKR